MIFIAAPSANFDAGGLLSSLEGASVWASPLFNLPTGNYRLTVVGSVSEQFVTTGNNAVLGDTVLGNAGDVFLIAPAANFAGQQLESLSGCILSKSTNITALIGGAVYRAMVLAAPSSSFDALDGWVIEGTVIVNAPALPPSPLVNGSIIEADE